MSDNDLSKLVEVSPQNGRFFVTLKSNVIQRWAARQFQNGNYYTLTGSMWRRACGKNKPEGAVPQSNFQTLYFLDQEPADSAAQAFVDALRRQNII
jgi:hypothetical protein